MSDVVLKIRGLCKSFDDKTVLDHLDLDIREGEKIALIGPSGGGKSVLLRCVERLIAPEEGSVEIYGEDILARGAKVDHIRQKMGMVYQNLNLFEHLDVMDNLCLAPVRLKKMSRKAAEGKAMDLLSQVGMSGYEHSLPEKLSGGQKQRVAIARSMMMEPRILLMDEPTSALDPTMAGEVLATIRSLGNGKMTLLMVTHEMKFAREFADRVLFLEEGYIYEAGTPEEIFESPQKEGTIRFILKLKRFEYHVDRRDYDLMEMQGGIMAFCQRYQLDQRRAFRLQLLAEELIGSILPKLGQEIDLTLLVEHSEKDHSMAVSCRWKGPAWDPLEGDDLLTLSLLKEQIKDIIKINENEENQIICILKE